MQSQATRYDAVFRVVLGDQKMGPECALLPGLEAVVCNSVRSRHFCRHRLFATLYFTLLPRRLLQLFHNSGAVLDTTVVEQETRAWMQRFSPLIAGAIRGSKPAPTVPRDAAAVCSNIA